MAAIVHGIPIPMNTLTELLPVTFPIALSAVFSFTAAALEANVSGREVPRATNVMAVTCMHINLDLDNKSGAKI